MIQLLSAPAEAAALFGAPEPVILRACLTGSMGAVYGDAPVSPRSALALLGDFAFFAGQVCPEWLDFRPPDSPRPFTLLIPRGDAWRRALADRYGPWEMTRYAVRAAQFDRAALEQLARALPDGYTICNLNEELYDLCQNAPWSRDLTGCFPSWTDFSAHGLGVLALQNGVPVAGAGAYAACPGAIEIETDTRADHRRRGLARACCARLILTCLDRGVEPGWDAHTPASLALAEQLGYRLEHAYPAFAVPDW